MWPLLVAALLGAAEPTPSRASPEVAVALATRVVVLMPRASDRRVDDVIASVRAGVDAKELELVLVPQADESTTPIEQARRAATDYHARGVFWLELRDASAFYVYLWLPDDGAALRRRVPEAAQSVEAAVEAMSIIVRNGSLALARGRAVAMEAIDPAAIDQAAEPRAHEPARVASAPTPSPTPERRLWLSLAYEGLGLGSAIPWQSGGAVELTHAVHRLVKIGAAVAVVGGLPMRSPAELRVLRPALAAVLGVGGLVHPQLRIEARVLPALELLRWRAPAQDRGGLRAAAKLGVELVLRIHLVPRVTLDVGPGADVALTASTFVLCEETAGACVGADRRSVLVPWRVRPRARLGLSAVF